MMVGAPLLYFRAFSNPRLPNPHLERMIASIDLETGTEWSERISSR
jgi:hypothetical protein